MYISRKKTFKCTYLRHRLRYLSRSPDNPLTRFIRCSIFLQISLDPYHGAIADGRVDMLPNILSRDLSVCEEGFDFGSLFSARGR